MGSGGDLAGSCGQIVAQLGTTREPELHCVLFIIPDPSPEDGKGPITFKNPLNPSQRKWKFRIVFGTAQCLPVGA